MRAEQDVVKNSTDLNIDDKLSRLQDIGNRYEARARRRGTPVGKPTASSTPITPTPAAIIPTPPTSVPPSGEQVIVIDRRPNSPTFGKRFSIDANDIEKADRAGYKQE